jgi:hypothetical protein
VGQGNNSSFLYHLIGDVLEDLPIEDLVAGNGQARPPLFGALLELDPDAARIHALSS